MEFAIQKWYKNIATKDKQVFGVTFLVTLFTHAFKLLNFIPNHDSLYSFYSKQDIILSGRWSLTYAAAISSWFDIQWLIGLLAVIYIALAAVVVVKVLDIQNTMLACMVGVLMGTYPSVAATFTYMFTADAYYLAMLLAALAAWLMISDDWKKRLCGSIALGVSMGIYQAYVSFCIVLLMVWLIKKCLVEEKAIGRYVFNFVYSGVLGGVVYVVGLYTRLNGRELSSYQGIGDSTLIRPISEYIQIYKSCWPELIELITKSNVFGNAYISYVVKAIWVVVFVIIAFRMFALLKGKKYAPVLWTLAMIAVLPMAVYCLKVLSSSMFYHTLMVQSVALIWIIPLIILDNAPNVIPNGKVQLSRILSEVLVLGVLVTAGNWIVGNNITYLACYTAYEKTYALSVRIVDRIEQLEGYETADKLYITGKVRDSDYLDARYLRVTNAMTGSTWGIIPYGNQMYINMINQHIGGNYDTLYAAEDIEKLTSSTEFQEMAIWPNEEAVQIIGDTIVVKLGE